jgi:hypothetical protein
MDETERKVADRLLVQIQEIERDKATAIGQFSMAFLRLEATVNGAIHEVLGLNPLAGNVLTDVIQSARVRLEILWHLADQLPLENVDKETIFSAVRKADALNAYRNSILHGRWAGAVWTDDDPMPRHQKFSLKRASKKVKSKTWKQEAYTVPQIMEKAAECDALAQSIIPVIVRLSDKRHGESS